MVGHTPSKLDALRQAAAIKRAQEQVPPAVLAAAAAADNADDTAADAVNPQAGRADGAVPVGDQLVNAEIHAAGTREEEVHGIEHEGLEDDDADKISLATSLPGVGGGAGAGAGAGGGAQGFNIPPLPAGGPAFSSEWLAHVISSVAAAAASAAANTPARAPQPPVASPSQAPRRLNDRKVPDFWEDRPEF